MWESVPQAGYLDMASVRRKIAAVFDNSAFEMNDAYGYWRGGSQRG